jgi:glycosyltransferase involved in cell wall biosynthesis
MQRFKMRILQINKYHYVRGGADSVYFNTSELLKKKGHEVLNFAMKFSENYDSSEQSYFAKNEDFNDKGFVGKITSVPKFFYNREAEDKLEMLILNNRPDVAHLHIFYGSLTSSILKTLKKHRIPAVVSIHDYKIVCPAYLFLDGKNELCEKCQGKKYYSAVVNKCVKKSILFSTIFALEAYYRDSLYPVHKMFDRLIFVSKFAAEIHNKYKPELRNISRQLYNFDPALGNILPNHYKGEYFLYIGRLSKEKGLNTLIEAFNKLAHLRLLVVGTGDELTKVRAEAGKNTEFLGFKSGAELKSLVGNSSFVIVPSEWYENNPMAIIESYSLGKPVIASNIGGIPEIVEEGITGFGFRAGDVSELRRVIIRANSLSTIEYANISKGALNFANKKFHEEVHYRELLNIYEEAVSSHSYGTGGHLHH